MQSGVRQAVIVFVACVFVALAVALLTPADSGAIVPPPVYGLMRSGQWYTVDGVLWHDTSWNVAKAQAIVTGYPDEWDVQAIGPNGYPVRSVGVESEK